MRIDLDSIQWQVLPELLQHGQVFQELKRAQREEHKVDRTLKPKVKRKEERLRVTEPC